MGIPFWAFMAWWFAVDNVPFLINMISNLLGLSPDDIYWRIRESLNNIKNSLYTVRSLVEEGRFEEAVDVLNRNEHDLEMTRAEIENNRTVLERNKTYDLLVAEYEGLNDEITRIRNYILEQAPPTPTPTPGKATLNIKTDPGGVAVWYDKNKLGVTDEEGYLTVEVDPGTYNLTFVKDGYQSETVSVTVEENETRNINVILEPITPPTPAGKGIIKIKTDPGNVDVYIAGTKIGTTDDEGYLDLEVDPGTYEITFKKEGYYDETKTMFIKEGEVKTLAVTLKPVSELPPTAPKVFGYLTIESSPSARIFIGGKDTGFITPHTFELEPGTYDIRLEATGYYPEEAVAFVKEGETTRISKELKEVVVPEKKFKVEVNSDPSGAKILVNGMFTGKWTPDYVILYEGTYQIRVEKSGYLPAEQTITLE